MEKVIRSGKSFLDFKKEATTEEFPDSFTDYIKSFGETYYWEKGKFHVVTKAADAKFVLTSEAFSADRGSFFVSRMPNLDLSLIQDFFSVVKKMMVMSDGKNHADKRKLAGVGFEDHILDSFQSKIESTVEKFVQEVSDKEHFDFVEMMAKKLPSIVLADLFSIPEKDRADFFHWSNVMTGFFGGASQYRNEDGIEVNHAASSLKSYFKTLIAERENDLRDDYVSLILKHRNKFDLTEDEIVSQMIMMLVAGMATTTDQLSNIMFLLASKVEIQKQVKEDLNLIPLMIEEGKRLDPAVTFIFRVAKEKTFINNQPIEVGDVIFISSHCINRDFPNESKPNDFDLSRRLPHFAYGHGAHYCIGAKLARMEMQALFKAIAVHLPLLKLDESQASVRDHYSLSFSGFESLYLSKIH